MPSYPFFQASYFLEIANLRNPPMEILNQQTEIIISRYISGPYVQLIRHHSYPNSSLLQQANFPCQGVSAQDFLKSNFDAHVSNRKQSSE
jgi:hypothetical protein